MGWKSQEARRAYDNAVYAVKKLDPVWLAKKRTAQRNVDKRPAGRARKARYKRTPKGKESNLRYQQSPLGRENSFRYLQSPKGAAVFHWYCINRDRRTKRAVPCRT